MTAGPPTGRRLAWILAPLLLAFAGARAWAGYHELRRQYVVEGLFRTYQPPYPDGDAWVIDPRPGDLWTEVHDRYRPGVPLPPPPASATPEAWTLALTVLDLPAHPAPDTWSGAEPRVWFGPGGPWLLTGVFGRQPVFFDPARGVVMAAERLPDAPAIELTGIRENPW